jgi:acyl-CoA hydrolase
MSTDLPAGVSERVFSNYFLVQNKHLNHAGTLFGGTMMAWADELAYIAASLSFPGCDFVTKVFEKFDFISGAGQGAIVLLEARIIARGKSSVRVKVSGAWATTAEPIFSTEAVMVNVVEGKAAVIENP